MWLRALAGAYAGQVRDFRTDVGLKALRSGTAERVDAPIVVAPLVAEIEPVTPSAVAAIGVPVLTIAPVVIVGGKKRRR